MDEYPMQANMHMIFSVVPLHSVCNCSVCMSWRVAAIDRVNEGLNLVWATRGQFITWNGSATFSVFEGDVESDVFTVYGITSLEHAARVAQDWVRDRDHAEAIKWGLIPEDGE